MDFQVLISGKSEGTFCTLILTRCILMDFPMHTCINTRIELFIMFFKGSRVDISKKKYVLQSLKSLKIVFI